MINNDHTSPRSKSSAGRLPTGNENGSDSFRFKELFFRQSEGEANISGNRSEEQKRNLAAASLRIGTSLNAVYSYDLTNVFGNVDCFA